MPATTVLSPFHLAVPVDNLESARQFYGDFLGCREGRSAESWIDFDFFGHQLVVHLASGAPQSSINEVDGDHVPVPHFGVVLSIDEWQRLADKLIAAKTKFVVEPHVRFKGEVGEQATMFFRDPCGNALEFKAFSDIGQLFAK